jgi:hypothetical protein
LNLFAPVCASLGGFLNTEPTGRYLYYLGANTPIAQNTSETTAPALYRSFTGGLHGR